jgi:uncharacterized membrane protein YccC
MSQQPPQPPSPSAAWPSRALHYVVPFRARAAAVCAPGLALILGTGVVLDHPLEGAVAAGAAFSVGFGAHRDFRGTRWAAMAGAALGMTVAAFMGSLLGNWPWPYIATSSAIGALVAWLALHDENVWWIALQCAIAFFVAGSFAGSLDDALLRGAIVAAGGIVQMIAVTILRPLIMPELPPLVPRVSPDRPSLLQSHVIRAAISVALATIASHRLGLFNGHWAPMTALLVLKPGLRDTHTRGLARLAGTVGGCAAASVFAALVPERLFVLVIVGSIAAWFAYALLKAHYAAFTAAVTATVVMLVAVGGVSEFEAAESRIGATLVGGAVALIVAYLGRKRPPFWPKTEDRLGA